MFLLTQMKTLLVKINSRDYEELEVLSKKNNSDIEAIVHKALILGIRELKKNEAIEKIRKREWTVWKAASYCGMPYRKFLKFLRQERVPFPLSVDELERELYKKEGESAEKNINEVKNQSTS